MKIVYSKKAFEVILLPHVISKTFDIREKNNSKIYFCDMNHYCLPEAYCEGELIPSFMFSRFFSSQNPDTVAMQPLALCQY